MKDKNVLVVYYSFEGNTRFIAETMAKELDADLLELKVKKDLDTKGFMKYFWGGRQVVFREKPELLPLDKDPNAYDTLLIGTPVWSFTFAPALRTFFDQFKLSGKEIAVFCTHEDGPGRTLENMRGELKGNEIIGEKGFLSPLEDQPESADEARRWVHSLLSSVD